VHLDSQVLGLGLLCAIRSGNVCAVVSLINKGADVNKTVEVRAPYDALPFTDARVAQVGSSALCTALKTAPLDIVRMLLEAGANVSTAHAVSASGAILLQLAFHILKFAGWTLATHDCPETL
jgi:ankyrin repeat protein